MRSFAASLLCLLAVGSAVPQQKATVPAMNHLCSIQFDDDSEISQDSTACLNLLATTLKVSGGMQLLLTGSAQDIDKVRSFLTQHESIAASSIRAAVKPGETKVVQTSLVRPQLIAEAMPVVVNMAMAAAPPPPARLAPPPPTKPAPPAASSPAPNPYALGDEAAAWKASLQSGAIEYNVPPVMIAQQASTVTVVVHGYKDPNPHVLAAGAGTANATLKVSDTMQVDLTGSPTEFTITPQATQPQQFVPVDGYSTWIWSVTPINQASSQQLTIKVSLIPDQSSGLPTQPLAEKPYTVNVKVESLWSVLSDRWHKDPMKAIEYILPGGTGWAALGTLLTTLGVGTWLRNKLNKPAAAASSTNQNPTPAV